MNHPAPERPNALPRGLEFELRNLDLISAPLVRVEALVGPLLQRWSISSQADEHIWADIIPKDSPAKISDITTPAQLPPMLSPTVGVAAGIKLSSGRAVVLPWRPRLLADTSGDLSINTPQIGKQLGHFLRRIHSLAAPNDWTQAPILKRLTSDVPPRALATLPRWQELIHSFLDVSLRAPVLLHGEPASGHILIAEQRNSHAVLKASPEPTPMAVFLGWPESVGGSAALDVGHLIADLVELALIGTADGTKRALLLKTATSVREGYEGTAPVESEFWTTASQAAAIKILDHDVRLRRAGLHSEGSNASGMLSQLADHLLDPTSRFGRIFTDHYLQDRPLQ